MTCLHIIIHHAATRDSPFTCAVAADFSSAYIYIYTHMSQLHAYIL